MNNFYNPFQQCNGDIKSSSANQDPFAINIRELALIPRTDVIVDNLHSLCSNDLHVCCKPLPVRKPTFVKPQINKPKPPQRTPVKKQQTCGLHNPNGIEGLRVSIKSPSDRSTSTNFGEWPHNCIIFDRSEVGPS